MAADAAPREAQREGDPFLTHLLTANTEVAHLYEVLQAFRSMLRTAVLSALSPGSSKQRQPVSQNSAALSAESSGTILRSPMPSSIRSARGQWKARLRASNSSSARCMAAPNQTSLSSVCYIASSEGLRALNSPERRVVP